MTEIQGVPTKVVDEEENEVKLRTRTHKNRAVSCDHVVFRSPDLEVTRVRCLLSFGLLDWC